MEQKESLTQLQPEQAPIQGCQKLLQNGIFKEQLAQFFQREWQWDHYGSVLAKKTLIVSHGCDTLLAFHASCIRGNVVVRASDTDVDRLGQDRWARRHQGLEQWVHDRRHQAGQ